jgi:hypothetical protein
VVVLLALIIPTFRLVTSQYGDAAELLVEVVNELGAPPFM